MVYRLCSTNLLWDLSLKRPRVQKLKKTPIYQFTYWFIYSFIHYRFIPRQIIFTPCVPALSMCTRVDSVPRAGPVTVHRAPLPDHLLCALKGGPGRESPTVPFVWCRLMIRFMISWCDGGWEDCHRSDISLFKSLGTVPSWWFCHQLDTLFRLICFIWFWF